MFARLNMYDPEKVNCGTGCSGNFDLTYRVPSELVEKLRILPEISSIDLFVTSTESVNIGDFPGKMVELSGLSGVVRGADGALLYAGHPIHAVFEDFFLHGQLMSGDRRVDIVPETYFAELVKNVDYGAWSLDPMGCLMRTVTDYSVHPRQDAWGSDLVDSARGIVSCVADATGVSPLLLFERAGLVVLPDQMPGFLRSSRQEISDPDSDFPKYIL